MASVQVDSFDQTALVGSASLDSDNMVLVGSGEKENKPILAPKERTDRNSIVDALGFAINTHTMRISTTKEREGKCHPRHIRAKLWPRSKQYARAQDALSTAGKLWHLTYVVRAGRYFVWQLLRLTDLHKNAKSKKRMQKVVKLGWEFHNDIAFWKWVFDQQPVGDG